MVGRTSELAKLNGWFTQTKTELRRVIFVSGEPGIGKTTLTRTFIDSLSNDRSLRIGRGQCVEQYGAGEPYMPILEALTRLCREAGGHKLVEILHRLAPAWLAQMPSLVSAEDRTRLQGLAQGTTQQRMLREMAEALEVMAANAPLVLLLEDLHWSDPSTLDLIATVARRNEPARLMILGTYRPVEMLAGENPLRGMTEELELHQQAMELRLPLLSEAAVAAYVAQRFDVGKKHIASAIYRRSEGNPLFMVNVVDYLVEHDSLLDTDKIEAPRNIRQMIERNLQSLGADERRVLEAASVAGAEFSAAAIAAALGRQPSEIEACCTNLAQREQFVRSSGRNDWPDGTVASSFQFHHALYRETLYAGLPAGHTLELHQRIAQRLEAAYEGRVSEIGAELANHYRRAHEANKAALYFQLAAEGALERRAFREAERHYRDALALLLTLPESLERDHREINLQLALGPVLGVTTGWAGADTSAAYARASSLSTPKGTEESLGLTWGLWLASVSGSDLRRAMALGEEMRQIASRLGSSRGLAEASYARGMTLHWLGDFRESDPCLRYVCEHYRGDEPGTDFDNSVWPRFDH
jgi:predicted ATPase